MLDHILDFVFPPLCVHCRTEGAWLCPFARAQLATEVPLRDPLNIPHVSQVVTRGSYDCETLAQLIQALKYHYWTGLADILIDLLRPVVSHVQTTPDTAIVPVPLHSLRRRMRGFNQSILIARALGTLLDAPVYQWLIRQRSTKPQAGLPGAERVGNIRGAFASVAQVASRTNSVILVDDVITTGSTVAECASVLRQQGVQDIIAVALAKG